MATSSGSHRRRVAARRSTLPRRAAVSATADEVSAISWSSTLPIVARARRSAGRAGVWRRAAAGRVPDGGASEQQQGGEHDRDHRRTPDRDSDPALLAGPGRPDSVRRRAAVASHSPPCPLERAGGPGYSLLFPEETRASTQR